MSDPSPKAPPTEPIRVQLDEQKTAGEYVNISRIFHSLTEFVLDAMFLPPASSQAQVMARIVMSPVHAKQLLQALGHNVQLYEQKFGAIQVNPGGQQSGPGPGSILH